MPASRGPFRLVQQQSDVARLKTLIVKQNRTFSTLDAVQDKLHARNQELETRVQ